MINGKTIILIAAMNANRVIGKNGNIPWKSPTDLQYFKEKTMGSSCVMGRKTYESLPGKLPGRKLIVLSRAGSNNNNNDDVSYVSDIVEAVNISNTKNVFIIGGEAIYKEYMEYADKLLITYIDNASDGDTFFPEIDDTIWQKLSVSTQNECTFIEYRKITDDKK